MAVTYSRSMNVRMTAEDFEPVEEYAARHGVNASQAVRELVALGALVAHGLDHGFAISDLVSDLIGNRAPLVMTIAPDPQDPANGPTWLVTPEEVRAHEAGE